MALVGTARTDSASQGPETKRRTDTKHKRTGTNTKEGKQRERPSGQRTEGRTTQTTQSTDANATTDGQPPDGTRADTEPFRTRSQPHSVDQ